GEQPGGRVRAPGAPGVPERKDQLREGGAREPAVRDRDPHGGPELPHLPRPQQGRGSGRRRELPRPSYQRRFESREGNGEGGGRMERPAPVTRFRTLPPELVRPCPQVELHEIDGRLVLRTGERLIARRRIVARILCGLGAVAGLALVPFSPWTITLTFLGL